MNLSEFTSAARAVSKKVLNEYKETIETTLELNVITNSKSKEVEKAEER